MCQYIIIYHVYTVELYLYVGPSLSGYELVDLVITVSDVWILRLSAKTHEIFLLLEIQPSIDINAAWFWHVKQRFYNSNPNFEVGQ